MHVEPALGALLQSLPRIGQSCRTCASWEPLDTSRAPTAGLCRLFALPPGLDAWPITEAADGCTDWADD
ncbi:MAG: hypothetical protein KDE55_02930 [Novosphingobium sp.]|nr:hypothetical protein [Novosphingobium sp.]